MFCPVVPNPFAAFETATRDSAREVRMESKKDHCPDCDAGDEPALDRRHFLKTVGVTAATAASASLPLWALPRLQAAPTPASPAETAVKGLYDSLTEDQRKAVCFAWDYQD